MCRIVQPSQSVGRAQSSGVRASTVAVSAAYSAVRLRRASAGEVWGSSRARRVVVRVMVGSLAGWRSGW